MNLPTLSETMSKVGEVFDFMMHLILYCLIAVVTQTGSDVNVTL